jgi:deoxyribodipyrimidine photo-lyase
MTIQPERVKRLNEAEPRDGAAYVLYWMQAAQRAHFNHALEYAVGEANGRGLPLLCCFGLTDGYPEANARHYHFMLEGLADASRALAERGIAFAIRRGEPDRVALGLSKKAALVVCDRGYLKPQKLWRRRLAEQADCRVVQVEGEVVVPVETASPKHEYAARTLRTRIARLRDGFLEPLKQAPLRRKADGLEVASDFDLSGDIGGIVASLDVDHGVKAVRRFKGGSDEARRRLDAYLRGPFEHYGRDRNRPEAGAASHMSPYLHFGQISPVAMALAVREASKGGEEDKAAYLEELIVRRELAMNHVFYEERYDDYACLPDWCRKTLAAHAKDERPHLYTVDQLAAGETHDRYWNAGMEEMRETGFMHNHMRMYWGKKIVEWSPSPEEAFSTALRLNNRYFLDGRDANSFTNVAWLFGLHDRPWGPHAVFGNVRFLGQATLKKFDADGYVEAVERLTAAERDAASA